MHVSGVRTAFKEWAVVVDALGCGDQTVILRKGGIAEGPGGFRPEHDRFLLFPTLFHQQRERVVPAAQARFDRLVPDLPPPDRVRIGFMVMVTECRRVADPLVLPRLEPFHVWRPEVIAERFDWGRAAAITLMLVRVARLVHPVELPLRPEDGGCRSWVELARDVTVDEAVPVLDEAAFDRRSAEIRWALGERP